MSRQLYIFLFPFFFCSCDDVPYKLIDNDVVQALTVQDTFAQKKDILITSVGESVSDPYPRLLVKFLGSGSPTNYIFSEDCQFETDSTILAYSPAFIIDDSGEFRKNGLWVYTKFTSEGMFPFNKNTIHFSVDSVPNKSVALPTNEGVYIYEKGSLTLFSTEQSEDKYKKEKRDGFYFIPNKGRFFDRINLNNLR